MSFRVLDEKLLKVSCRVCSSPCSCAPCQETKQDKVDCALSHLTALSTVHGMVPFPAPALPPYCLHLFPIVALTGPSTARTPAPIAAPPLRPSLWDPVTQMATSSRTLKARTSRLRWNLEQRRCSTRGWGGSIPAREGVSGQGASEAGGQRATLMERQRSRV